MKDYKDYPITKIENLYELLFCGAKLHSSKTAFRRLNGDIPYDQFLSNVLSVSKTLQSYFECFFSISIRDPYLFAVAYFATIITGNVAVLLDDTHSYENIEKPPFTMILTDYLIEQMLSETPIDKNKLPTPVADNVCTIIYSSGTTSAAKGIMLSQSNLCNDVVAGLEKYRFSSEDKLLQLIPYYHAFGLVCDLLAPLLSGTVICIPDNKAQGLAQMRMFEPTMLNVPPAIAEAMLNIAERAGSMDVVTGGKLRKILCGGANLSKEIAVKLQKWNINAFGCYGVSECSPCISVNRDKFFRFGSAGIPLNCNTIRIADDGEILISGRNVMLGYYNDLKRTASVIIDGEYHTGDLGYLDEDGFLFVVGRKNNMIVFEDGTKCIPETLEEKILTHPSIQEALVYAERTSGGMRLCVKLFVPDTDKQKEVHAFLVAIPKYQPFYRICFEKEPLPKTATGKIRRDL